MKPAEHPLAFLQRIFDSSWFLASVAVAILCFSVWTVWRGGLNH